MTRERAFELAVRVRPMHPSALQHARVSDDSWAFQDMWVLVKVFFDGEVWDLTARWS